VYQVDLHRTDTGNGAQIKRPSGTKAPQDISHSAQKPLLSYKIVYKIHKVSKFTIKLQTGLLLTDCILPPHSHI